MKYLSEIIRAISSWAFIFVWFSGIVLANGGWSTLFAIAFPLWAFYLFVEKMLTVMGWI